MSIRLSAGKRTHFPSKRAGDARARYARGVRALTVLTLSLVIAGCSSGSNNAAAPATDTGVPETSAPSALSLQAGEVAELPVTEGVARVRLAAPKGDERYIVVLGSTRFDRTVSVPYTVSTDPIDGETPATIVSDCSIKPDAWSAAPAPTDTAPTGTAPAVGTTRKLNTGREVIDAKVIATSATAVVWADVTTAHPANLDAAFVDEFLKDFDKVILPRERAVFGMEPDLDGDGRIGLVFTPITYDTAVAYFTGCDLKEVTGCGAGNAGEFLYLTPPDVIPPPYNTAAAIKEILAHELGHLIHFNRKVLRNSLPDQPDSAYMAEGLGALAQDTIGFQAGNLYVTLAGLQSIDQFSFGEMLKDRAPYDTKRDGPMRGGAYLFARFLYDRAGGDLANADGTIANKGGPAFMRALLESKESVTGAISSVGMAKIEDVAMDFYTALAMSNREVAGGVAAQNSCFRYLPVVADPITMRPRGADLFATFHSSKMTGPKLQPIANPSGTIRFGGVEFFTYDAKAAGDLAVTVGVDPQAAPRVRVARVK